MHSVCGSIYLSRFVELAFLYSKEIRGFLMIMQLIYYGGMVFGFMARLGHPTIISNCKKGSRCT
jgi:hypothetical protein